MANLRELFWSILSTDAQDGVAPALGSYLGKTGTTPYGVYFVSPGEVVEPPFITYQFISGMGRWPEEKAVNIVIYSNDFSDIEKRIETLLDECNMTPDDFRFLQCRRDWEGPDIWDDNLRCYSKALRYIVRVKR